MFREIRMMGPLNDYWQQEGQHNLPRADKLTFLLSPTARDVLYSRPLQLLWLLRANPRELLLLKEVCIKTGISEETAH